MEKFRKLLWGFCFIVVGCVLGLNSIGITHIDIFFDGWWSLFIIVPCFIGLFDSHDGKMGNIIGLFIGVCLLFAAQGWISFSVIAKLIFPVILVAIGLNILFHEVFGSKVSEKFKHLDSKNLESVVATFAEQKVRIDEEYQGGVFEAIFGSIDLNLCKAKLKNETVLKVTAIFGGVNILAPDDVNIKVKSTPIFGGVSNQVRNIESNKKTIYVEAVCVFGGIEIK